MSTTQPRLLLASLLSLGLVAGLSAAAAPAQAQSGARAYAPEQLWTLNQADQARVISLEYREQSNGRSIPDDQLRFYLDQVRQSRWTFSQVRNDIGNALGGRPGGWRPGPGNPGTPGNTQQAIRCESVNNRQQVCATPWRGQSYLRRQLSDNRCIGGQNWFSSNGRITVSNGCRAEFGPAHTLPGWGNDTTVLRCESNDNRLHTCGSGITGRARLQRQLSNTRCVENGSFGVRNGSLWVSNGCRGEFLVQQRGNGAGNGNYSVTCSSTDNRRKTCAWDARQGNPRLVQQLSNDSCREGSSWGYSPRTGLWVDKGCRARFAAR